MDQAPESQAVDPEGSGLFLAEPVLAAPPATVTARRPRPTVPVALGEPDGVGATPSPLSSLAPPTPAEYYAAEHERAADAQRTFDATRAVKGPKVVVAKRRRRRAPVVLGVVAVLAGAGLGAVVYLDGGADRSGSTAPLSSAEPEQNPLADAEARPVTGAARPSGTLGDLEVTVLRVSDPFAYSLGSAPDGFRYVAVEVELSYEGDDLVEVTPSDALVLVDGAGRRWPLADQPFEGLPTPISVLGPGLAATSTPVFLVGDDASRLSLVVSLPDEDGELVLALS